mmetsp:Transcript_11875/g.28135  ORF Transcript_11875/g.28135 Transcript_11875/m.28135 type:complete len:85 (+) Transcript_11875:476-730(+)
MPSGAPNDEFSRGAVWILFNGCIGIRALSFSRGTRFGGNQCWYGSEKSCNANEKKEEECFHLGIFKVSVDSVEIAAEIFGRVLI